MDGSSRLHRLLLRLFGQHCLYLDIRHLQTLAWMVVGLILSGRVSLTAWGHYLQGRALFAQSYQRRFRRFLANRRIHPLSLYLPLIRHALAEWGSEPLYLALDTSLLWNQFCLVQLAVIYRGRAVPVIWRVMAHPSSAVAHEDYHHLLTAAAKLLPPQAKVIFLADRGFADLDLLRQLKGLGWHFRIRIKSNFWVQRPGGQCCKVGDFALKPGEARLLQGVAIGEEQYGPLHLALARHSHNQELWYVLSDEVASLQTFWEYGHRFAIEEEHLDIKSGLFGFEAGRLREAGALGRLYLVTAVAVLYLSVQGQEVVRAGQRRWVDPHWSRGSSYLKIGRAWVLKALVQQWPLCSSLKLSSQADPQPAMSSRKQRQTRLEIPIFRHISSEGKRA